MKKKEGAMNIRNITRLARIGSLLAATLILASCTPPFAASGDSGTSSVPVGSICVDVIASLAGSATASSRAVVADFTKIATKATVSVTGGDGVSQTATIADLSATAVTITGIAAGSCEATVAVFKGETQIGSGTTTFTLTAGDTKILPVPVSYNQSGSGGYALTLKWPAVKADYASATLNGTSVPQPSIANDGTECTAIFADSAVRSGSYPLIITFRSGGASGTTVGFIVESVNIWDGQTSSYWLDSAGVLKTSRTITESELYDSTTSLAGLTVTGLAATSTFSFNPATTAYDNLLVTGTSICVTPIEGITGQTISYVWTGSPVVSSTVGTNETQTLTLSSANADGSNTLAITVTAPDRQTSKTYTLTVYKAYTVRFNLNDGLIGTSSSVTPQIVRKGNGVTDPGTPSRSTFSFGGWYSDTAFATPWNIATSTVSADTTLYAKWTGADGATIAVPDTSAHGLSIAPAAASVTQWTKVTVEPVGTDAASFRAISSGWAWYLDGVLDPDTTGPMYTIKEYATSGLLGTHRISATVKSGSITYSATASVTITAAFTKTVNGGTYTAGDFATSIADNLANTTVLADDVTITGTWTTSLGALTGNFNGGGHTITFANGSSTGLFTSVSGTVVNVDIAAGTFTPGANDTGILANTMSSGTISGCSTSGTIAGSGRAQIGGLLGTMTGGTLSNCTSTVAISGGDIAGGLVGRIDTPAGNTPPTISNCAHTGGTINLSGDYAGGIVGINGSSTTAGAILENCYNLTDVTGRSSAGGLCGTHYQSQVTGCYSRGTVTMTGGSIYCNAGGLFGCIESASVSRSYAAGTVQNTGSGTIAGGIVGYVKNSIFTDCYARGAVTGASAGAGFASTGQGASSSFTRCFAAVTGNAGTQGFIYTKYSDTFTNCFYDKTLNTTTSTDAIGLVTANMKISTSFTGWDFDTVWAIDASGVINGGYPYLRQFGANTVTP